MLEIADEDVHRLHFHVRDGATGGIRAMDKYLERIDDIRRIQTYISGRARREGVPVVENANVDRAIDGVMGLVMDAAERFRESRVTQVEETAGEPAAAEVDRPQCQCETFARVTERAALAGARWLGRADKEAAEEASFTAARKALEQMPISGKVVIGAHEDAEQLAAGTIIGAGGEEFDLALDPLEGRAVVARGGTNAISMIAAAPRGSMPSLPDMYMRKMAVGPRARGQIELTRPVGDNIRAIADAFGRMVNDITAIVLDRPRHHDLIEEIRAAGARIKLIQDGDVTASISAAVRGTNDHLAIGIGGTRQAVLAAAALRCLGGELQAQLWPTRRAEIEEARAHGIDDPDRVFTIDDLAPQEVIVVATGVSNGDLLRGVRFLADSARTHSLVMCTRCNWVRFVDGIHFFARERREEVRLS